MSGLVASLSLIISMSNRCSRKQSPSLRPASPTIRICTHDNAQVMLQIKIAKLHMK